MSLEAATNIAQLNPANPVSNDQVQQGDDHIRMLKSVLQFCFPNATKPFNFPTTSVKSSNFSLLTTDLNTTFLVDTTAGIVTATLPTLAAADAGWEVAFIKTNAGTNTMFIAPASGTIQSGELVGLAKTRRCIPGRRTRVLWTGTAWIADRVNGSPVGTIVPVDLATVPVGYEIPNGQTLGVDYPDFILAKGSGVTRDTTGRVIAGKEALSTRLTAALSGIAGNTQGAAGGLETHTLTLPQLPSANLSSGSLNASTVESPSGNYVRASSTSNSIQSGTGVSNVPVSASIINPTYTTTISGTVPLGGTNTPHNNVQPTIVLQHILVVE